MFKKYFYYITLLLLILVTCSKNNNPSDNKLDDETVALAKEASQLIQQIFSINDSSMVMLSGPIQKGTELRKNDIEANEPTSIMLPDEDGTYYAFLIDDDLNTMLSHPHRFGWVNIDNEDNQIANADYPFTIYPPGVEPEPFEVIYSLDVDGIDYYLLNGEGGADVQDVTAKSEAVISKISFGKISKPNRTKIKEAFVLDGGDLKRFTRDPDSFTGWQYNGDIIAEELAENNADPMQEWLGEYNFNVTRTSQYWGNSHPYIRDANHPPLRSY